MRFVTYRLKQQIAGNSLTRTGEESYGLWLEAAYGRVESVVDLPKGANFLGETLPATLISALEEAEKLENIARRLLDAVQQRDNDISTFVVPLDSVELLAPIPRPLKNIFCIGKNYADHAIEMGGKESIPEHPMVFTKAPTTVIGPEALVDAHASVTNELDYEGELAIVIGKTGKRIPTSEAMDYIFGYTIINDVTARDLQRRHKQFLLGKSLDTHCPMGPAIVHHSLVEDVQALRVETRVNGELRQNGTLDQLIFDIPTLISTLSAGMTLEPGDIIATGTPAGVGNGFNPPKFLKSGDVVEITISSLGTLKNKIG